MVLRRALGGRGVGLCVGFALAAGMASEAAAQRRENGPPRGPQGQQGPPDAATMFRRLDVNGDGKLTLSEARENERRLLERIFSMAGKPEDGSVSRDEFQRVSEQNQRGGPNAGVGRAPEGGRPGAGRPPEGGRPPGNRPEAGRPEGGRPMPERERGPARERGTNRPMNGDRSTATRGETSGESRGGAERPAANRLAGTWRGWVVDGRGENPNAGHMQMELRIEGNTMTAREIGQRGGSGQGLGDGTFELSGTGNSGNLDATGTSGRHDGIEYLGIYEINGDTLKWCVGNRGRPRPQEYSTGRQNYYMILRRVTQ